jgi:hypothetical protein
MLFTLKRKFLEVSVDLQTALVAEVNEAEGATEHKRENMSADCFEDTGTTFSAIINTY